MFQNACAVCSEKCFGPKEPTEDCSKGNAVATGKLLGGLAADEMSVE